jgi:hypothetical protein
MESAPVPVAVAQARPDLSMVEPEEMGPAEAAPAAERRAPARASAPSWEELFRRAAAQPDDPFAASSKPADEDGDIDTDEKG